MTSFSSSTWLLAVRPLWELIIFLWRVTLAALKVAAAVFAVYGILMFELFRQVGTSWMAQTPVTVEKLLEMSQTVFRTSVGAALIMIVATIIIGRSSFGPILPARWRDGLDMRLGAASGRLKGSLKRWLQFGRSDH
ncbi:hypothetical protein FZ983_27590 [Azospirillum sp. B21]|uniref:hypothetical protein n=1 Tax=Azospirillum sp. B21 TaxID=2607496 RepID=UPI0011EC8007|nr:hypothetical protein [Azospirillum sp. B21]KAA0574665.1 hypothetical protein FZ983_27590 [Azospirillum sp. B21]